ncbi:hypothetical protein ACN5L5_002655 [Cronobacter turicensis]
MTQLNGIQWRYDVHSRTVEKDNGPTRWRYRYDGEHRLTDVISQPRDRNKPQVEVSFRYDLLERRISKTRRQFLAGQPTGKTVTTRFVWEGFRLLNEPGAKGTGKNILKDFNDKITSLHIEKRDQKGNWKKCGARIT